MRRPELSVIVSTWNRPKHLSRCLHSLNHQDFDLKKVEIVIADDGSDGNETLDVVEVFSQHTSAHTVFITHEHNGFRLAKCRNMAAAVAASSKLLFLDGDCIVPKDFIRKISQRMRAGFVVASDCYRLDEQASLQANADSIESWDVEKMISARERKRLRMKTLRAIVYSRLAVSMRPRLTGCAFAIWKEDLQRVNGFDENYIGWGLEDRDLQKRLQNAGVRTTTGLDCAKAIHLWHPLDPTFSRNCIGQPNHEYFHRPNVPVFCRRGLNQYLRQSIPVTLFCPNNQRVSASTEKSLEAQFLEQIGERERQDSQIGGFPFETAKH